MARWSPKRKAPVRWPSWYEGLVDALEKRRADGTALTGTLDHKQTGVDLSGPARQLGQVLEAGEDPDVFGFVDDGLDTQRSPFFEVLLDPAVLVGEVHLDLGAGTEDSGLRKVSGSCASLGGTNTARISSGRPTPMLSATRASKNPRARRGSSKTRVREISTWRMDSSQK